MRTTTTIRLSRSPFLIGEPDVNLNLRFVALGIGAAALLAGVAGIARNFTTDEAPGLAMVTFVIGVMFLGWSVIAHQFRSATKPFDDGYHLGFEIGYDKGYVEGHKSARPVVVAMPTREPLTCLHVCKQRKTT